MKHPFNRSTLALSLALAAAYGCDANHVLGTSNGNPGTAGSAMTLGGAGSSGAAAGSSGAAAGSSGSAGATNAAGAPGSAGAAGPTIGPLGPTQSWTGYIENATFPSGIENATFPSGSDALKLTFATDANGNAVGTIVFGQGTPPPPATDPNAYYPPLAQPLSFANLPSTYRGVTEGFAYPINQSTMTPQRLRVHADLTQLWQSWCALQTPPSDGSGSDGSGRCLPNWAGQWEPGPENTTVCQLQNPTTKQWVTVSCGKFVLCALMEPAPCTCGAATCAAAVGVAGVVSLDIALDGDTGEGSITSGISIPGNGFPANYAHLTKDP